MAGIFDRRPLEAVADPEIRNTTLARDLGGAHHPASAAIAEAARHQDAVRAVQQLLAAGLLERFRLDPSDVHAKPVLEAAVIQRLVQALVRVFVADVLADDVNGDLVRGVLDPIDEVGPGVHPRLGLRKVSRFSTIRSSPSAASTSGTS